MYIPILQLRGPPSNHLPQGVAHLPLATISFCVPCPLLCPNGTLRALLPCPNRTPMALLPCPNRDPRPLLCPNRGPMPFWL